LGLISYGNHSFEHHPLYLFFNFICIDLSSSIVGGLLGDGNCGKFSFVIRLTADLFFCLELSGFSFSGDFVAPLLLSSETIDIASDATANPTSDVFCAKQTTQKNITDKQVTNKKRRFIESPLESKILPPLYVGWLSYEFSFTSQPLLNIFYPVPKTIK
jgi:hypothetical protein